VYGRDIVKYAWTLSEKVTAVDYFRSLSEEDLNIILTEAAFVTEHCSCVSDLLTLLSGNSYPVAHRLYPALEKIAIAFNLVKNASNLSSVLGEETKAAMNTLSNNSKREVAARMKDVAKQCFDRENNLMAEDPANVFFKSVATLFDPVKMMSALVELVAEAAENIPLLRGPISTAEFQVLHCVLKEEVKSSKVTENPKYDVMFEVLQQELCNAMFTSYLLSCL